jgi:anhydro-N-acetylmuramic acid kinase
LKQKSYHVVGAMSGTSLDGLDLAECFFHLDEEGSWHYRFGKLQTLAYSPYWQERLRTAIELPESELKQLDNDYARYVGNAARLFSEEFYHDVDALSSHGHTVFHQPERDYTFQLGNAPILAQTFGKTVVCDFRVQDVALGGQGAPLVPMGDQLLFSEYDYCLNLGGFANISFFDGEKRLAYDVCPVNIVLNELAQQLGQPYDAGGALAAKGAVRELLLQQLNALPFYTTPPPKSLGVEWVRAQVLPLLEQAGCSPIDALRTVTEHIAMQLAIQCNEGSTVLVTGGGAYNEYLLKRMRAHKKLQLVIPQPALIEYKEALIFAFLGVLRMRDEVNCFASVTGASRDHSSGRIFTVK